MKKNILLKIVLLFCVVITTGCKEDDSVAPQALPTEKIFDGNVILSSQAQVDDFAAENYNIIDGDLLIGFEASSTQSSDITSLANLTSVTGIGGSLNISNNPVLPDLEGLNSLNFVRGLEFKKNTIITGLQALINVPELTFLQVEDNDALKNLEGLSGVTNIQQYLIIRRNNAMLNLNGLNNLEMIEEGNFALTETPVLDNISALSNLVLIGGTLTINYTPLASLNGLNSLETLDDDIFMAFNTDLVNYCALNTLIIDNNYSGVINHFGNGYNPAVQDILDGNCSQ